MIRNYLLIALRNILRNKIFSTVNILGLAFGIGSALLIALWLNDEVSYDHFHSNVEKLYRVMENQQYTDGRLYTFASTPTPLVPHLKSNYPEIERASRFTWDIKNLFRVNDKSFYESGKFVDPDFLKMFSFEFAEGGAATALRDKKSIVITERMARKYFGDDNAMGKVILVNTKDSYTVTAVLRDIPKNSSIQFEYLLPFEVFWDNNKSWLGEWGNNNVRTFVMLRDGTNATDVQGKVQDEVKKQNKDSNVKLFLQPFGDAYLFGAFENGVQTGGRIEYVRIFSIVAVFVLVIACINFMNLSTAQATHRAKEVGLRKVIGAVPGQLFKQFMGESFLTVAISAAIGLFMVMLILPIFNEVIGKSISLEMFSPRLIFIFIGIVLFTAFAAGFYPAIFMSDFKPVQGLKGQLRSGNKAARFRKTLVIVQFSLSIILIISTTVVFRQMNFMQVRDIGFDRSNVFYAWMSGDVQSKFDTFRNRLLTMSGIENVTAASHIPIDVGNSTGSVNWKGKSNDEEILFSTMSADFELIESMKMQIVDGRGFDRKVVTDTSNFLVNQTAAVKFGFENVAGQDLELMGRKGKIIGVVKDFNFGSLHTAVEPLIIQLVPKELNCVLVRVDSDETDEGIASTAKLWREYAPGYPFQFSFLDQDWQDMYKGEEQRGRVFNTLSVLSILISCLGLFGLSAFSAERRTKELGIRKALGATVPGLVKLVGREFAVLVMIAVWIGCPIGWYIMDNWLKRYAYHIDVGYLTLVIAALICFIISMLTISYHAIKVAKSDPVESLRYE